MKKYTKACKWCNKEFQTNKEDKEYCCHNHKTQHFNKLNPKPKKELTCIICEKIFYSNRKNAECCSRKCTTINANLKIREQRRIENNKKYEHVLDIPTCKICGWKSRSLQNHLTCHDMTVAEYKLKYNAVQSDIFHSSYIEEQRQKMSGENNPGYQHNGTMSSFSEKFKKYDDLTESETKQAIQSQIKKANKTKKANKSYNTTIDFYIKKGYTLEESEMLLKDRQATFSLEKCIDKYGEEEGNNIFLKRQEKWLNTLNSKTPEEKDKILQGKLRGLANSRSSSKISRELFKNIHVDGALWGKNELRLKIDEKYFRPDFNLGNKVIEFYGNYWHANPQKYKPTDIIKFPKGNHYTAEEVWKRDQERINKIKQLNYEVLIIWESDYRTDPEGIINKCLNFLNTK